MSWLVDIAPESTFIEWQPLARFLLHQNVPPQAVFWQSDPTDDLFTHNHNHLSLNTLPKPENTKPININRHFLPLARYAACHNDPQRFAVLYRLLWRLAYDNRDLLLDITDSDVRTANRWAKQVGRERHKMKAFVRFRRVDFTAGDPIYIAWFEPEHYSLKLTADFFRERFYNMEWSILTPYLCAHWSEHSLNFTPGCAREQAPAYDQLDEYWRTYYANIFNPARLKVKAMCAEMPQKYWHNLPEATLIKPLIEQAERIKQDMLQRNATEPSLPSHTRFDREHWLAEK